jgi:hypothetical protein
MVSIKEIIWATLIGLKLKFLTLFIKKISIIPHFGKWFVCELAGFL